MFDIYHMYTIPDLINSKSHIFSQHHHIIKKVQMVKFDFCTSLSVQFK